MERRGWTFRERTVWFPFALCFHCFLVSAAWPSEIPKWELTFEYSGSELSLLHAVQVPEMKKADASRKLDSCPVVIQYELTWLNESGQAIHSTTVAIPLIAWSDDMRNRTGGVLVPSEGCCPVRLSGPPPGVEPAYICLKRTRVVWNDEGLRHEGIPEAFRFDEQTFHINEGISKVATEPGPVGIAKINDAGEDENRISMVILGDGYTEQNLADGVYEQHVERLMEAYRTSPPYQDYLSAINIYRIDVVSREEGADLLDSGVLVDTYLDAKIEGVRLKVNHGRVGATIFQYLPPVWPDSILVLVNTPVYSGNGADRIATSSTGGSFEGLALHEQGHQFADLADEYEHGKDFPPGASSQQNCDTTFDRDLLKWSAWVNPSTPLPTPETEEFSSVVGAFEGAEGWPTDIYRPYLDCCMRSLDPPFCPVCQEIISTRIVSPLQLADSADPGIDTTVVLDENPTTFSVNPLPIYPLAFEWKLAGSVLPDETGTNLTVTSDALDGAETAELELTIVHPTPYIRKTLISRGYSWTLRQELSADVMSWHGYE